MTILITAKRCLRTAIGYLKIHPKSMNERLSRGEVSHTNLSLVSDKGKLLHQPQNHFDAILVFWWALISA